MTRFDPCEEVQEHIQLSMSKSPCAAQEILLHLRSSTRSCGSFFVYTNTHLSTVRNITRTSTLRCIHFLGTSIKFRDALNVSWCLRTPTVQTPFVGTCYLSLGWIVLRAFAHSLGSRTLHFVASFTNIFAFQNALRERYTVNQRCLHILATTPVMISQFSTVGQLR